jgi:hypothetical protein
MAGTVVTVELPNALLPYATSITYQIGCHTDGIWGKTEWTRMPEMVRRWAPGQRLRRGRRTFGLWSGHKRHQRGPGAPFKAAALGAAGAAC